MRLSVEALAISIVVRRAWMGSAPYGWEVHWTGAAAPIYVCSDHFRSMHEAHQAGHARLGQFIPKRSRPPGVTQNREWLAHQVGSKADHVHA